MKSVDIDALGSLDSRIKEMSAELSDGKASIREDFARTGMKDYAGKQYMAKVSKRVSTKFNEGKVLDIVRKNGMDWLLTEVVDLRKLEDALVSGEVDPSMFADCVSESTSIAVTFRRKK